jgi:CRISPR-associated protein Csx10
MKAITFTINLLEPLLATGLEGDPNAGVSMQYIAGSVLRGAIIGLYQRNGNTVEANNQESRDLFFNGKVCYLNAYPQIKNERTLPTPLSWQEEKDDDSDRFYNFAIKKREEKTSYKNLSSPFFAFESPNDTILCSPKFRLAVHTQRDAKKGRSTADEGAVFRYESIAEGTKFSGVIISEDDTLLNKTKVLIENNKKVFLGGSRSAGYGKSEFTDVKFVEDWKEFEPNENEKNEISIYLLSNVILRDANGNFKTELTADDFGLNATPIKSKTFIKTEVVGGFNQKWGLPLPQAISIKAGSVFTFEKNQNFLTANLEELVKKGIGEKLSEGFGRIGFNLATTEDLNEVKANPITPTDSAIADTDLRDKIIDRILRQKMDSHLVKLTDINSIQGNLSNSQNSRLRTFIRDLQINNDYDVNKIEGFIKDLKGNSQTQFESIRIGAKSFINWTKEKHFENSWTIQLGTESKTSQSLENEYNLLLIYSFLKKASKENKK